MCLYQDANYGGWGVAYKCVWPRGSYHTWSLRGSFPVNRREGVSSYIRNGVPDANLLGYIQSYYLGPARGNVATWFNDKAAELSVRC